MSKELMLSNVKNLENQVRLFLYENYFLSNDMNSFPLLLDLASSVTPIQYMARHLMELDKDKFTYDEDDEENNHTPYEYTDDLYFQLERVIRGFRLLVPKTYKTERVNQVWYSIYEVFKDIDEWTGLDHAIYSFDELEPYLDAE